MLVKGDLGKGKPFTQKLPDENFTYGKPLYRDPENAVDCKNYTTHNLFSNYKVDESSFNEG